MADHSYRPFANSTTGANDIDSDDEHNPAEEEGIPSFAAGNYQSSEMRRLLLLREPDSKTLSNSAPVNYKSADVFPDWVLTNTLWKSAPKTVEKDNEISEILKVPVMKRTQEQVIYDFDQRYRMN